MFGRLRGGGRRHGRIVGALTVSPLVALCLTSLPYYAEGGGGPGRLPAPGYWGALLLLMALFVPLWWRRDRPREVFAVVALVSFGQWVAGIAPMPANLAVLVAMFTVAARCRLRWAVLAWLVTESGVWLGLSLLGLGGRFEAALEAFLSSSAFVVAIWVAGIYVNTRRRYLEGLEERAERAERDRDQQVIIAKAAERARIARELHDVIAHNVSVMVVQADGAGYTIDTDPEQARSAVRAISSTGRQALTEMRRLVGVLREGTERREEEYAPQPGLAQLDALVAKVRAAGLPVELTVDGTPHDLAEGEQLVIYRIVQEALTNTLKHAGPAARAWVEVTYRAGDVRLRVVDDGRGAAAPQGIAGHGLVGMRERVAMYGGDVSAGPRSGGGFQVIARLPVSRAA
jgi:signal transduction histidine kinase